MKKNFENKFEFPLENGNVLCVYLSGTIYGGVSPSFFYDDDGLQFDCGDQSKIVFDDFFGEEINDKNEIERFYFKGELKKCFSYNFEEMVLDYYDC